MINWKLTLLLVIPFIFVGCRKKIELVESSASGWQRIGSADASIGRICEFNNEIYVKGDLGLATNQNNVSLVGKYTESGGIVDILNGGFFGNPGSGQSSIVVTDMEVHEGKLYFGGNFRFFDSAGNVIGEDLVYLDATGFHPVPCNENGSVVYLRDLESFEDALVITGTFLPNAHLQTQSIDRLQNGSFTGYGDLFNQLMSAGNDGELYCLGGTTTDIVQRWNGTGWTFIPYSTAGGFHDRTSLEFYSGTLYMGGNLNGVPLRKLDGSNWVDVPNLTGRVNGMKVINGQLFVYGEDLVLDGNIASNVLVYDGTSWEAVGNLLPIVRDLELINGELHAGTGSGLYFFKG